MPSKNNWFGKNCIFFCGQWEETEYTAGPNYKDDEPVLFYCNHLDNPNDTKGNCNEKNCPLFKLKTKWKFEISLEFEPRDIWFGLYWDNEIRIYGILHFYICLIPCLPIHLTFSKEL